MSISINKRDIPASLDKELVKKCLKIIKKDFTVDWLENCTDINHPLQILWSRTGKFATVELSLFGYCLRKIKYINKTWYYKILEEIKCNDIGMMRARVLELFVASQFHNPPDKIVELLSAKTPGYDVKVKLKDGSEIYIQVKNSSAMGNFQINDNVYYVENIIKSNLKNRSVRVYIFKTDNQDPTEIDWYYLKNGLPIMMESDFGKKCIDQDLEGGWHIRIVDLDSIPHLHPSKPSYVLLLGTPFSKSETGKISAKIAEACSEFKKKREPDTERTTNIALVCPPLDAPLELCGKLTHEYFDNSPEPRASGVLFYKISAVTDIEKNERYIAHVFHLVLRKDKMDWLKTGCASLFRGIDIGIGRGSFTVDGIDVVEDINTILDAGHIKFQPENTHICQSGEINYLVKGRGEVTFNNYTGIKRRIFYIDSDRLEKEAPTAYYIEDDKPSLF